jgi:hypothetical protein
MTYTQVFGGNTIYPSDVSYKSYTLTSDITLSWPIESAATGNVVARIIDVSAASAQSITMPPADETGVGQTILFNNVGAATVTVKNSAGGTLLSISSGAQWELYLTDNSTAAGTWRSYRFGAATANAQASSLAGSGLTATGSTLAQQYQVDTFASNYTAGASDRAKMYVWTGSSGTLSLPSASVVGDGWFFNVRNAGTGTLTIDADGTDLINGGANITLQPEDSAVIVSDGLGWYTIGLGQRAVFAFDYTSVAVTGGNYTLSGSELNRIAYEFVGTLTSDAVIIVPPTIQQYWVSNLTTGSYTLSVKTPSQVTPVSVGQNQRAILYSNGSDVVDADTSSGVSTPVGIADGGTGATSASGARINLGGTSVGIALFTASTQADAWTALGIAQAGTVDGGVF